MPFAGLTRTPPRVRKLQQIVSPLLLGFCYSCRTFAEKNQEPLERCLVLVHRLVRRSLGEVGSFSEGGCEADSVGNPLRAHAIQPKRRKASRKCSTLFKSASQASQRSKGSGHRKSGGCRLTLQLRILSISEVNTTPSLTPPRALAALALCLLFQQPNLAPAGPASNQSAGNESTTEIPSTR